MQQKEHGSDDCGWKTMHRRQRQLGSHYTCGYCAAAGHASYECDLRKKHKYERQARIQSEGGKGGFSQIDQKVKNAKEMYYDADRDNNWRGRANRGPVRWGKNWKKWDKCTLERQYKKKMWRQRRHRQGQGQGDHRERSKCRREDRESFSR